jgi:hypothetical protein
MISDIITSDVAALAPFDYQQLDMETRLSVQQFTREIKERIQRSAQTIVEIGERLAEVRERLEDGQFTAWLQTEFAWSRRTAYNFISVFERFGRANVAQLDIAASALYLLSAPSTPDTARAAVIERAETGERITHQAVKQLIEQHQPLDAAVVERLEAAGATVNPIPNAAGRFQVVAPPGWPTEIGPLTREHIDQRLSMWAAPPDDLYVTPTPEQLSDLLRRIDARGWAKVGEKARGIATVYTFRNMGAEDEYAELTANELRSWAEQLDSAAARRAEQRSKPFTSAELTTHAAGQLLAANRANPAWQSETDRARCEQCGRFVDECPGHQTRMCEMPGCIQPAVAYRNVGGVGRYCCADHPPSPTLLPEALVERLGAVGVTVAGARLAGDGETLYDLVYESRQLPKIMQGVLALLDELETEAAEQATPTSGTDTTALALHVAATLPDEHARAVWLLQQLAPLVRTRQPEQIEDLSQAIANLNECEEGSEGRYWLEVGWALLDMEEDA